MSSQNIPIKFWVDIADVESGAIEQAKNLANLPFAFHHVAIMPDVHEGMGTCIGSVFAATDAVVINCVGVDIGCGMGAVKTSIRAEEVDVQTFKDILGKMREQIPVGHSNRATPAPSSYLTSLHSNYSSRLPVLNREWGKLSHQLGSLGGGNHFLELQRDTSGFVWIMVHSGSRNFGKQVADYYNKVAVALNKKMYSSVPESWKLAFLPVDTQEGRDYITEMNTCVQFAFDNRRLMLDTVKSIFVDTFPGISFSDTINIAHNYVTQEHHFGKNVFIHRKGATSARKDQLGIIPGSQGTFSYIVRGLGNVDSFTSCSHGAGRPMSRRKAKETLNLEDEKRKMDEQGILHGIRGAADLDEAPSAYKDIDIVMNNQTDLVEIVEKLSPIAVIKG